MPLDEGLMFLAWKEADVKCDTRCTGLWMRETGASFTLTSLRVNSLLNSL